MYVPALITALVGALVGATLLEMLIHAWRDDRGDDTEARLADAERRLSYTLPKLM